MLKMRVIGFILFILLGGCSTDTKLFGYTLWGDYNNLSVNRPSSVRIQKGETLYSIARRHDVPIREIIELNNLRPPYTLKIGQIVRLPQARYHIVGKGDTLYNISKRYNVDMPTLSKTNNLQAPFTLKIGQKLLLPGSLVTHTTSQPVTYAAENTKIVTSTTPAKTNYSASSYYKEPSTKRKNKFAWPVKGQVISKYGPIAKGRNNDGINIKAAKGTPVKAADDGVVAYAGNELKGFGNLILIKHADGWVTAYAHNDAFKVRKGQTVKKGDTIATVGTSGGVDIPQLHFETRAGKKALNPQAYLQ
ncbi:MAG: M23 family metallopeptidase [Alphaproteobacteria bacterium]|nr:M23 family metallopeptidase [Alphaproteobacteria bacterium]